jgi:hypothetical protein
MFSHAILQDLIILTAPGDLYEMKNAYEYVGVFKTCTDHIFLSQFQTIYYYLNPGLIDHSQYHNTTSEFGNIQYSILN